MLDANVLEISKLVVNKWAEYICQNVFKIIIMEETY